MLTPQVLLYSSLGAAFTVMPGLWYQSLFATHPGLTRGDPAAFTGGGRAFGKRKVWCKKCLDRRIDLVLRLKACSGEAVVTDREAAPAAVWDMPREMPSWTEFRRYNCLKHLRSCELRPRRAKYASAMAHRRSAHERDTSMSTSSLRMAGARRTPAALVPHPPCMPVEIQPPSMHPSPLHHSPLPQLSSVVDPEAGGFFQHLADFGSSGEPSQVRHEEPVSMSAVGGPRGQAFTAQEINMFNQLQSSQCQPGMSSVAYQPAVQHADNTVCLHHLAELPTESEQNNCYREQCHGEVEIPFSTGHPQYRMSITVVRVSADPCRQGSLVNGFHMAGPIIEQHWPSVLLPCLLYSCTIVVHAAYFMSLH